MTAESSSTPTPPSTIPQHPQEQEQLGQGQAQAQGQRVSQGQEHVSTRSSSSPPRTESSSSSSSTPFSNAATVAATAATASSPSYAMIRVSKKNRPPVSIFDLPCPPKSAPPQDDESFFAHLDTVEKTLEEEDAGQIPTALEAGPQIIVESLNKKRVLVQETLTETPSGLLSEGQTEALEGVPSGERAVASTMDSSLDTSLDSNSSASGASHSASLTSVPSSLSSDSSGSQILEAADGFSDSLPPEKKVRFSQDLTEVRVIEARKTRPNRPKPRLPTSAQASSGSLSVTTDGIATDVPDAFATTIVSPPRGRVLTPGMPSYEDQQFQDWLSGNSPPPPLPEPIAQSMSAMTAEGSRTPSQRHTRSQSEATLLSRQRGSGEAEEEREHEKRRPSSPLEGENSERHRKTRQAPSNRGHIEIPPDAASEREDESTVDEAGGSGNMLLDDPATHSSISGEKLGSTYVSQSPTTDLLHDSSKEQRTVDAETAADLVAESVDDLEHASATSKEQSIISHNDAHASSSTNIDSGSSATLTSTRGRTKKEKETAPSIAARIGSRRKHIATQKPPSTMESPSAAASGSRTATAARRAPVLRRTVSVIDLDEDEDDETLVDNRKAASSTSTSTKSVFRLPMPVTSSEKALPSSSFSFSSSKPLQDPVKKSASSGAAESSKSKSKEGALSELRIYVIPTNMDTGVFNITRKRVIDLRGQWLGPQFKVLSTDPRAKAQIPALDQERTTHIVTAFTNIEDVKRFLNVDGINPKIAVVNRDWLSDTIMYKRPMEPQGYVLRKAEAPSAVPATAVSEDTPPPSQGRAQMPTGEASSSTADKQRFAKFQSTETGDQVDFNEIMQGIQEGSLDDADISDDNGDDAEHACDKDEGGEEGEEAETNEHETTIERTETEEGNNLTESDGNLPYDLTPELMAQLKSEKRCFRCREIGHWMNRCPHSTPGSTKDEVLLQIINSGKSEGKARRKILYQCQSPHVAGKKEDPRYNKAILEQLKILMDHYEENKNKGNKYHFKVINYRKAITAIRALDYEITSENMALKVPRVGKKIAQKIGECVALGRIKKLDHLNWDKERSEAETLFRSVYGVGAEKATEWYNKGLRTLDDVRKLPDLTKNQISGLQFYDDLLKRIPRSEVEEIGKIVESSAKRLHPDIQSQVTGSYRRGQLDCGDIDFVIARPEVDNGDELFLIMEHILKDLINQGFLVDHLSLPTWSDDMANKPKHFKYMGICKLPGEDSVHHHIDILVVPWKHLGAVLIYFTGNDICNRSMRLLASKRGMRLSDKGLFAGVFRGPRRKRLNEGHWVAGRTEKEIFDYLKINYLEPYEREC